MYLTLNKELQINFQMLIIVIKFPADFVGFRHPLWYWVWFVRILGYHSRYLMTAPSRRILISGVLSVYGVLTLKSVWVLVLGSVKGVSQAHSSLGVLARG